VLDRQYDTLHVPAGETVNDAARLMRRQILANGTTVFSVRQASVTPWVEVCRAAPNNPWQHADLDRTQKAFETPLVRDIFFDILEETT